MIKIIIAITLANIGWNLCKLLGSPKKPYRYKYSKEELDALNEAIEEYEKGN